MDTDQKTRRTGEVARASDEGTTSVEYAVLIALILLLCISAVRALGDNQSGMWGNSTQKLQDVGFIQ